MTYPSFSSRLELVERHDVVPVLRKVLRKPDLPVVLPLLLELEKREEGGERRLDLLDDKLGGVGVQGLEVRVVLLEEIPDVVVVKELLRDRVVLLRLEEMLADRVEDGIVEIFRETAQLQELLVSPVGSLDYVLLYEVHLEI